MDCRVEPGQARQWRRERVNVIGKRSTATGCAQIRLAHMFDLHAIIDMREPLTRNGRHPVRDRGHAASTRSCTSTRSCNMGGFPSRFGTYARRSIGAAPKDGETDV